MTFWKVANCADMNYVDSEASKSTVFMTFSVNLESIKFKFKRYSEYNKLESVN